MTVASVGLREMPVRTADTAGSAGRRPGELALMLLFGVVLLDSMESYLLLHIAHVSFPVNAVVPALMLLVALRWGAGLFVPPPIVILELIVLIGAFLVGVIFGDIYGWERMLPIGGMVAAFLIGFAAGRWIQDVNAFATVLLVVGSIYSVVCIIALLKLIPDYFPIINAYGNRDGETVIRPEVTIDQNFQVFYLFYIGLLLFLPVRWVRTSIICLASLAAAYTLARVYSRSGVLLFGAALAFAWVTPLVYPRFGRRKLIVLPLLAVLFAAWNFEWIVNVTAQIVYRFTDPESYGTFYGRVYSAQYLLQHLFNPEFWVPQGDRKFLALTGNIPHFNPTAVYLEGGLLGLLAWFGLVAWPVGVLGVRYLRRGLDAVGILFFGGGLVVFAAQLSLNAPLYDHVWLWAGAATGALYRPTPGGGHVTSDPLRA